MKIVSLFSGCGGLDLGFENAGFNVIWANEKNKKIFETYNMNHSNTKLIKKSIKDVKSSEIPECDGIIGGPPCQSWSVAGAGRGIDDNKGQLFYEYIRVIRDKNPKFFLAENVPGILYRNNIDEFHQIVNLLEDLGYNVSYRKIKAEYYGVPQLRRRVFIIGIREDFDVEFEFPDKTHSNYEDHLPNLINLEQAIGDLPEPKPAKDKNYSNSDLEINGNEYYIGGYSSRFMSRNRRKRWDELAYTVEASGRHAKVHPENGEMKKLEKDKWEFLFPDRVRRLSIRESARIQTFPDDFNFYYSKLNDAYKMIGNAVPVRLAYVLANQIKNLLFEDI